MKITFTILFCSILSGAMAMPGKLLVIGGGSEKSALTAWNYLPYKWAVENAPNKKVAIIAFEAETDTWLSDYFTNTCGAVFAKHFNINSASIADDQVTYDSLLNYDMVFLKGGDQWDYYSTYKNTKTQEAIEAIFNRGGVICGTSAGAAILSKVVFTAQMGSVYPYEAIENPMNNYMKLADDFLPFLPGLLFDTHFAERGRLARLVGLIARWKFDHNQNITGIGVDDLTAFAIDSNMVGTVYGTGAINIVKARSDASFSIGGSELIADSVQLTQLLHGCTYNLVTGEFDGFDQEFQIPVSQETGNYTVVASGTDNATQNNSMLIALRDSLGNSTDPVLILTGTDQTLANSLKANLESTGTCTAEIYEATATTATDAALHEKICYAKKILFAGNTWSVFQSFWSSQNGVLLQNKLKSNGMISAFTGDNSRFAGKTIVENYLEPGAAYYAELTFTSGMQLLTESIIMPNSYSNSDIYENTITSVPYAMQQNQIRFGFWLTNKNYMVYKPVEGKSYVTSYGTAPVMIAENRALAGGFSSHTSSGSTSSDPRMIAGFDQFELKLFDENHPFKTSDTVIVGIETNKVALENVKLYFANNILHCDATPETSSIEIVDILGKAVFSKNNLSGQNTFDLTYLSKGMYVAQLKSTKNKTTSSLKFNIKH